MHMADALISPAVGGTMWAVSAGVIAYCSRKVRKEMDHRKIPLMGVMGAFIFTTQMLNFTIPMTGSSGHLGGGMILAILLGPYAAFLTIASVMVVQSLFFADGGLLALGCNIFNLGVFPAFIAYPLIYKKLVPHTANQRRITVSAVISAVIGLQLGALSVVLEIVVSDIASLPFSTFVSLMQPIHLVIGIIEGLVTAAIVSFVYRTHPEILLTPPAHPAPKWPMKTLAISFLTAAILSGVIVSWFASKDPDGLEWSINKITGKETLETEKTGVNEILTRFQKNLAFLPDYSFKQTETAKAKVTTPADFNSIHSINPATHEPGKENREKLGKSISGLLGGLMTLALAGATGIILKQKSRTT